MRKLFLLLIAAVMLSSTSCIVTAPMRPPAGEVVVMPGRPYHDAVWVPGHWRWSWWRFGYVWVRGHWIDHYGRVIIIR
ncbi:MAG: hypothetical protein ABSE00_04755 [Chitinispirillaceae bacterium]|jgi:hypothetical protein